MSLPLRGRRRVGSRGWPGRAPCTYSQGCDKSERLALCRSCRSQCTSHRTQPTRCNKITIQSRQALMETDAIAHDYSSATTRQLNNLCVKTNWIVIYLQLVINPNDFNDSNTLTHQTTVRGKDSTFGSLPVVQIKYGNVYPYQIQPTVSLDNYYWRVISVHLA